MSNASSITGIIALWPSLSEFAADIDVDVNTAKQMRRRGSIAVRHWPALVVAARKRGYTFITTDVLVQLHVEQAA